MNPMISVVMPVYNVVDYIGESIQSILAQTYENFEFIIIDDASTDGTYDIIQQFHDKRIIKLQNTHNMGTAYTINKGIACSKAKYIARMDGDDISLNDRFEKQLYFMENHPNLLMSGTHMHTISKSGKSLKILEKPIGNESIKISLFFGHTSMAHPSLMIRRELLNFYHLRYDPAFQYAEDYDLYCRCTQYSVLDNLPEPLIKYRIHSQSVSQQFCEQQKMDARTALFLHLRRIKLPFTLEDFKLHTNIAYPDYLSYVSREEIFSWFQYLKEWNRTNQYFEQNLFEQRCGLYKENLLQKKEML